MSSWSETLTSPVPFPGLQILALKGLSKLREARQETEKASIYLFLKPEAGPNKEREIYNVLSSFKF